MKIKRLVSMAVVFCLLIAGVSSAYAASVPTVTVKTITRSQVPANITPIVVKSEAEALAAIKSVTMSSPISSVSSKAGSFSALAYSGTRYITSYKNVAGFKIGTTTFLPCKFNSFAEIRIGAFGGVGIIEGVNYSDCSLTGYTAAFDLSDKIQLLPFQATKRKSH